jgi:hypothetical protein
MNLLFIRLHSEQRSEIGSISTLPVYVQKSRGKTTHVT